jgi:hypothetical protein
MKVLLVGFGRIRQGGQARRRDASRDLSRVRRACPGAGRTAGSGRQAPGRLSSTDGIG